MSSPHKALPERPVAFSVLTAEAAPRTLAAAVMRNHQHWFYESALAVGGDVTGREGIVRARTPEEVIIPFPTPTTTDIGPILDSIVAECRALGVKKASCWSGRPIRPTHLGACLLARGFEWAWRPHWMTFDLSVPLPEFSCADGVEISVDENGLEEVAGLPYHGAEDAAKIRALNQRERRQTWHFVARLDSKVVGHSLIFVSAGALGIAGMYNVGVVPEFRKRGIGKAVTVAACEYARALGCRYIGLNSAADGFYRALGFVSRGFGQSWWMHERELSAPPTPPELVTLIEAVGTGDIDNLNALPATALPDNWDAVLTCGQTLMGVGVVTGQKEAMRWLEERGATLGVLHAWDSRQKNRVPELLRKNPALANECSGPWAMTPLHEAVQRNDKRLVRALLKAKPDMTIRDTQFNATSLDWAKHFNNTEMVALLEGSKQ